MANSRKAAVSAKKFLAVYVPAVAAANEADRKTTAEIAKELGMGIPAVSARASALRKAFADKGKTLNYPKSGRGAGASVDGTLDEFASMLSDLTPPDETEGETAAAVEPAAEVKAAE